MSCTCQTVSTPWAPGGFVPLSATSISAAAALAVVGTGLTVLVENLGPDVAYVALGDPTVVATAASTPLQPGDSLFLPQGTATYAAAITAAAGQAASLVFTNGAGTPNVVNGQLVVNDAAVVAVLTETGTFASDTFTAFAGTSNPLFAAAAPARRLRVKAINLDYPTESGGGGGTVWLRWGAPAVVRGTGSFFLLPGGSFDDAMYPNQLGLNVIAENGATVAVYWETY